MTSLPHPGRTIPHAVQSFRDYIDHGLEDHAHQGLDGHHRKRTFVCRTTLVSYWTAERVKEAIGTQSAELALKIITSHLETLSILCYIGYPLLAIEFMKRRLTDNHLPAPWPTFSSYPWPQDKQFREIWRLFNETRWMFSPLVLDVGMHQKEIPVDQIIPVNNITQLVPTPSGNEGTEIYQVQLHRCCSRLPSNEVIFKTLAPDLSDLWDTEAEAYATLFRASPGTPPSSLARCFGSFVQTALPDSGGQRDTDTPWHMGARDRRRGTPATGLFLVLEYVPGGALTSFHEDHRTLLTSWVWPGQLLFWHQMFNILLGLDVLHNLDISHCDIKESNILYTGAPLHKLEEPCFKLIDYGRSLLSAPSRGADTDMGSCHVANVYRMAPEVCGGGRYPDVRKPVERYTAAADIWALGCVFSEMLVRTLLGEAGVAEYKRRRTGENAGTPLERSPWGSGFHDGRKRLSSVDYMHRKALEGCPEGSIDFLHAVSQVTLREMLQPRETRERFGAAEIRMRWLQALDKLAVRNQDPAAITAIRPSQLVAPGSCPSRASFSQATT